MKKEEFEQRTQNFELLICYMVEQEVTTQGNKMSRGVELVLVTRQEIVILLRAKPIYSRRCTYGYQSEV
jgi:hypothetical protein